MSIAALKTPGFDFSKRSNWTPVYERIENRAWASLSANLTYQATRPTGPISGHAILDLRYNAEGYNLQQQHQVGAIPVTRFGHWLYEIQSAIGGTVGPYVGPAVLATVPPGAGWLDPDEPIALDGSGYRPLNDVAKLGLSGGWRRMRPREIQATTATQDREGNPAAAGQRAYLYAGHYFHISGGSQVYRCVAPGSWVRDDSQRPDVLDSENPPSSKNHCPWGYWWPGDYFGDHLWWEIARRLELQTTMFHAINGGANRAAEGFSGEDVQLHPEVDPEATYRVHPPTSSEAVSSAIDNWTAGPSPTPAPTSASGTGGTLWASRAEVDGPFWDENLAAVPGEGAARDIYVASANKQFPRPRIRCCYPPGGFLRGVLRDTTSATGSAARTFDAHGSGVLEGKWSEFGAATIGPGGGGGAHYFDVALPGPDHMTPQTSGQFGAVNAHPPRGFTAQMYAVVRWNF